MGDVIGKAIELWTRFVAVMATPEGQAFLDYVEYLVQDVMDGPEQSPPKPTTGAERRAGGPRVAGVKK